MRTKKIAQVYTVSFSQICQLPLQNCWSIPFRLLQLAGLRKQPPFQRRDLTLFLQLTAPVATTKTYEVFTPPSTHAVACPDEHQENPASYAQTWSKLPCQKSQSIPSNGTSYENRRWG
ncbi:MAG: hypothetical protein ACLSB9_34760 [Hydrogeniiclostridium mannosilyticum]